MASRRLALKVYQEKEVLLLLIHPSQLPQLPPLPEEEA
jgi:hypothetical protein